MKNIKLVLVNEKDEVVGYKEKFAAHKLPVFLHRAISVVIFDTSSKKIMLQKRASGKPTWPLFWSNTCCTHPFKEENYLECASRRLEEEMGFRVPLTEKFRFIYQANYDQIWGEYEYDVVFEGRYEGQVKPDPQEAADWKWMKIDDLLKDVKFNPEIYTPWFKIILEKLYGVKGIVGDEVSVKHLG